MEGMVVNNMYRMCVNSLAPATEAARLVVSDIGEILSPKYDPEIMAPATKPSSIFNALPIPNNAMPMVAIVDQELPVATETVAHSIKAPPRKKVGVTKFKPK